MWRTEKDLEKTLTLGKIEGGREGDNRGWDGWMASHPTDSMDMSLSKLGDGDGQGGLACCGPQGCKELDMTEWLNRRRQWHPTPVLLPGKSHGWRSLVGCSPWGCQSRTWLSNFTFTFHLHALEKEMATHSSVLAWRIPGTGEPGGLPSVGLHGVRRDWSDLAAAAEWLNWTDSKRLFPWPS